MILRNLLIAAFAFVLVSAVAACTDSVAEPSPAAAPVIQVPTVDVADNAIQSHLATKVLEVGNQRVAFLLNTQKALIDAPQVQISVAHAGTVEPIAQVTADYNPWPYGVRGSYAAPVEFPAAGKYQLTAEPIGGPVSGRALIDVEVLAESPVPSIGDTPPSSETKTLGDGIAVFGPPLRTLSRTRRFTNCRLRTLLHRRSLQSLFSPRRPFAPAQLAGRRWTPYLNSAPLTLTRPTTSTSSLYDNPRGDPGRLEPAPNWCRPPMNGGSLGYRDGPTSPGCSSWTARASSASGSRAIPR